MEKRYSFFKKKNDESKPFVRYPNEKKNKILESYLTPYTEID